MNDITFFIGILIALFWPLIIAVVFFTYVSKIARNKKTNNTGTSKPASMQNGYQTYIPNVYQRRWMFTNHEKYAYYKLKPIADELGYTVFAKVRLLDLLEPRRGIRKYKTYFYKIQAKHVDFVLCDKNLVARYIIELDDSSHDAPERRERDRFVDAVVQSVGYKIIHTRTIDEGLKQQIMQL